MAAKSSPSDEYVLVRKDKLVDPAQTATFLEDRKAVPSAIQDGLTTVDSKEQAKAAVVAALPKQLRGPAMLTHFGMRNGRYKLKGFRTYAINCVNTYNISADTSGIVANFASCDPRMDSNWSGFLQIFDAFCITGMVVNLLPYKNNWTGGLIMTRDFDGVTAISYAVASKRADKHLYSPLYTQVPTVKVKFNPTEDMAEFAGTTTATLSPGKWYDTAKSDLVARGGVQINSISNVVSVGTFQVFVNVEVHFCSRQ